MQTREKENQEHETIFPAIVGEGELREGVAGEGCCEDVEGGAGLALDGGEDGVGGMRFGEEGVDAGVKRSDYGGKWLLFSLFLVLVCISYRVLGL